MKRYLSLILVFAMLLSIFPVTGGDKAYAQVEDGKDSTSTQTGEYEIYPKPQSINYGEENFTITEKVNLVFESTIDTYTKEKLYSILKDKGITYEVSEDYVDGVTNFLVGTNGSNEVVDTYFKKISVKTDNLFENIDSHVVYINNGTIGILGKDTDASFYGLVSIHHIFDQIDRNIRNLQIEDFADTKVRGFIEGFYGIPWSDEERISLMEFGGEFKMTSYIFAPKDDTYHKGANAFDLYPEERLEEIKEMAEVGNKTKTRFVWSIHPFGTNAGRDESKYKENLEKIIAKFNQLYDVGVR